MRLALIIWIGIHAIIHLFGFFKSFGIFEFSAISQPISKTLGLLWLLGFVLFAITVVLLIAQSNYWFIMGMMGVIISQFVIINHWSDAKFGTIANLFISMAIIVAYSNFSFKSTIKKERIALFKNLEPTKDDMVTKEALVNLPPVVQKWLTHSGVIGKPYISSVHLVQELKLKMKPEQAVWYTGRAEQYITVEPPGFNWSITTQMNPVLKVAGRDKFENGKGEMTIKLLSLIPVAQAKNDKKLNQAALQRYLAEIVWLPSASLSSYIKWESIDSHSARATMAYKGTIGSGEFYFDENGDFIKFVAMRYQDSKASEATRWTVVATKTEERNGIKIPVECEASWALKEGEWTWLKLEITDIQYHVTEISND